MGLSMGPGAQPPSSTPSPSPQGSHPLLDSLDLAHQQAKAQFGKIAEVHRKFTTVREGLDSLAKLGEAVTAEDVVEQMGKMVAAGMSPEPLIAAMAGGDGSPPMPEGGQALQGWVQQMEQKFGAHEGQLQAAHAQAQHQLGVSAAKVLLGHHIADKVRGQGAGPAQAPAAPTPPNPLAS